MAEQRVTQTAVETLILSDASLRVTQNVAEVLIISDANLRVTQTAVEVLMLVSEAPARKYGPPIQMM